jgi:hypothetical protein
MPSPPPSPAARAALCRAAGRRRPTPPDELRAPHRPGRRREGRSPPRYGSSPWPRPVRRPSASAGRPTRTSPSPRQRPGQARQVPGAAPEVRLLRRHQVVRHPAGLRRHRD